MKTIFMRCCALVPLAIAAASPAAADESLGTMVVSANRTETPIDQVGSSVTVITQEDLEKSQATSVLDALQSVPGVSISGNGGYGTKTYLNMRGATYKHILILIDGVEASNPGSLMDQGGYDLAHMMTSDIERIEVLRGNQSTLYGSQAIGGVISITTKNGRNASKPFEGSATLEGGSFNTRQGSVALRGRSDAVYYSANLSQFNTSGFDISKNDHAKENDGYKNRTFSTRVGADLVEDVGILDKLNVEGLFRNQVGRAEIDASGPVDGPANTRNVENTAKLSLNAKVFGILDNEFSFENFKTETDYFSAGDARDLSIPPYDGEINSFAYKGVLKPIDDHTFVFGVENRREDVDTTGFKEHVGSTGYYGNYQLELLEKTLTLTAGARVDDHETFGTHATYRGTVGYRIPVSGTRLHASYGTGFKAPTAYLLYGPPYYGYYMIGNPDLKPEESRGYDIGIEQAFFNDRLVLGSTFYNTRFTNQIVHPSSPSLPYTNLTSSRAFGFENSATVRASDEVSVSINHTYTQSRDDKGQVAPAQPHHEGNLRVDYSPNEVEGLDLWARGRFSTWRYDSYRAGHPYVGGWSVWDIGGSYEISEDVKVFGRVENLFDKDYYTKSYYATSGVAGYAGLTVKF